MSKDNESNGQESDTVAVAEALEPTPTKNTTPADQNDSEVAGPSSAGMKRKIGEIGGGGRNEPPKVRPRMRKGGISILGNDPKAIGLDQLEKRGLGVLLKAFQSKPDPKKLNVNPNEPGTLEKSKIDWAAYKKQRGIEEELHNHTKSRDTYIDKQEFLNRTDHRQFEIEKKMRATERSRRLAS